MQYKNSQNNKIKRIRMNKKYQLKKQMIVIFFKTNHMQV